MSEGNPVRDNGPFMDEGQAAAQFAAATAGIPGGNPVLLRQTVIGEVLLATGALPAGYENDALVEMSIQLSSEECQVIAGWVMRAWRAGWDGAVRREAERLLAERIGPDAAAQGWERVDQGEE